MGDVDKGINSPMNSSDFEVVVVVLVLVLVVVVVLLLLLLLVMVVVVGLGLVLVLVVVVVVVLVVVRSRYMQLVNTELIGARVCCFFCYCILLENCDYARVKTSGERQ